MLQLINNDCFYKTPPDLGSIWVWLVRYTLSGYYGETKMLIKLYHAFTLL